MKRITIVGFAGALIVALAGQAGAQTGTVTFDPLPTPTDFCGDFIGVPNGYAGFQWSNLYAYNAATYLPSNCAGHFITTQYYSNGVVSGMNAAFNGSGMPATISRATPFVYSGGAFSGAFIDEPLTIQGYFGGVNVFTQTINILAGSPAVFGYAGGETIDQLVLTSGSGKQFSVDDLQLSGADESLPYQLTTPEPNTLAMVATGFVALVPIVRRRRR